MAEQNDDFISSIRNLINSELIDVNTSINGVVVSYSNGLATVRPTANKRFQDGEVLPFPSIFNVPVRWPSFNGGQCGFKGPIRAGDNVLVVFSQQAKDGTDDQRRFDLSDAYCIPAHNSTAAQGGNNDDTVMYFGAAYIKITSGGAVEIVAPGGHKITAPDTEIISNIKTTGMITNNGKNIGNTHTHSGVQTGGGNTGGVV